MDVSLNVIQGNYTQTQYSTVLSAPAGHARLDMRYFYHPRPAVGRTFNAYILYLEARHAKRQQTDSLSPPPWPDVILRCCRHQTPPRTQGHRVRREELIGLATTTCGGMAFVGSEPETGFRGGMLNEGIHGLSINSMYMSLATLMFKLPLEHPNSMHNANP